MDILKILNKRAETVKEEFIKSQEKVTNLTKSLQEAQAHLQSVSGHFNEVQFLLSEFKKSTPLENSKEIKEDGKINEQTAK